MDRENRYLVIKYKDSVEALTETERKHLADIAQKIAWHRLNNDKLPLEAVVVESDWPEYEPTWRAIAARVDGSRK